MRLSAAVCIITFGAELANPPASRGIEPCEVARLTGDPWASAFGASADISGDYIVVGDPGDDQVASWAGAAYLFQRRAGMLDWERKQKIFGSDINFFDSFGYSVAIDGDRLVVGAPHNDPAGAWFGFAYVFVRVGETWVEQQKLVSSGSSLEDGFGFSVAISGDVIAVGAPGEQTRAGRTYIFQWNGSAWMEQAILVGSDTVAEDTFGTALSLNQGRLLVGAMWDDNGSGSAYVFRQDGVPWVQEAKIMASDTGNGGFFGASVSLFGHLAVIGAYAAQVTAPGSGAAYAYSLSGGVWRNEQKLVAPDPQPFQVEYFGRSVGISQNLLLIGASSDDDQAEGAGSAYVFERNENAWIFRSEFYAANSTLGLGFGLDIALDGSYAIVSSNAAPHIFTLPQCIPAITGLGACFLSSVLMIAGVILLKRRKLNMKSYSDL